MVQVLVVHPLLEAALVQLPNPERRCAFVGELIIMAQQVAQ
jgi:hypothetical protein